MVLSFQHYVRERLADQDYQTEAFNIRSLQKFSYLLIVNQAFNRVTVLILHILCNTLFLNARCTAASESVIESVLYSYAHRHKKQGNHKRIFSVCFNIIYTHQDLIFMILSIFSFLLLYTV